MENKKPYGCKDTCNLTTGRHSLCGSTSNNSQADKFGIGVVLYFRFVKLLAIYFFIFMLLEIPALILSITGKIMINSRVLKPDIRKFCYINSKFEKKKIM